ncbi:NUDIX domain-containing protein [Patescibacteria group bacterium]|nr:NUDIX domain-containing protein [Patescibacteria group bacterium]MBU1895480.1 NUDIX domain-containing protein [Patescibacteria group bacterium]
MKLPENSIIASGPVIIEEGKVLLNKEQKEGYITPWMFVGGEVEEFDKSLEDACHREVKEEMGIDIEIIRPLEPIMIQNEGRVIVLIHYLANRIGEIIPGEGIVEWGWHDINNLPEDCTPNVYKIISKYKEREL